MCNTYVICLSTFLFFSGPQKDSAYTKSHVCVIRIKNYILCRQASPGVLVKIILVSEEICSQDDSNHKHYLPLHCSMGEKSIDLYFSAFFRSVFLISFPPISFNFSLAALLCRWTDLPFMGGVIFQDQEIKLHAPV